MYRYRISKYNPQYRDEKGIYSKEEWTSYSDVGKIYNGKVFDKNDYLKTEMFYCNTVLYILKVNKVKEVVIEDLELNYSIDELERMLQSKGFDLSVKEKNLITLLANGNKIKVYDLHIYLKLILRECFWCRLIDYESSSAIEFGYDYYIYLYSKSILSDEVADVWRQNGIYIEKIF